MDIKIAIIVIVAALAMALFTFYNYEPYLKDGAIECVSDSDCVPEQCCHPVACVPENQAPDCKNVFCTAECVPGSMDCQKGYCACVNSKCTAIINNE